MNKPAILRTVRRLDEHTETREVGQLVIERGIPFPSKKPLRGELQATLEALEVGDSFLHTHHAQDGRNRAKMLFPNRSFAARKIGHRQYRIWRIR